MYKIYITMDVDYNLVIWVANLIGYNGAYNFLAKVFTRYNLHHAMKNVPNRHHLDIFDTCIIAKCFWPYRMFF